MGRWPAAWPEAVHMIGIGGVAMSGLATLLAGRGVRVQGSDRAVYPPASDMLATAGIKVLTPFDSANLTTAGELVVVGNAISRGNEELEAALNQGLALASMAEVIERLLVPGKRVSVIAGTHGKTTTASLLAWLHVGLGRDPSFLVGGLPGNFPSGAQAGTGPDLILEGDEYDTAFFDKGPKFLHYWPSIAVIGAVEFDHADIYPDIAAVERAFALLVRLIPGEGTLIIHGDDPRARLLAEQARGRVLTFGLGTEFDLGAVERVDRPTGQSFTLLRRTGTALEVNLPLPGAHNAKNALAALLAAECAGLPFSQTVPLLSGFRPPKRRLEITGSGGGVTVYDDFAHHPSAIESTLATLRGLVPEGGRLLACIEPRSNTMVRRFFQETLERVLAHADGVFLGKVDRPDRFAPAERLDVEGLVARLNRRGIMAEGPLAASVIFERVQATARPGDLIAVMSNGAFEGLPRHLGEYFAGLGGKE